MYLPLFSDLLLVVLWSQIDSYLNINLLIYSGDELWMTT